ncbi:luciferase family oxidoreductase group 1 [Pullulanibacillus pueri]|uniref:Luciferase-like domain-containing protein n=1 Tax=Pullulanibacillus pueri TaxID=1437324 RepID=A0A8J2ZTH5_9BACL|nr:LLM class flavin-dependent oxidoreductase [Pullulanibacillus pueri]MBM7680305.1 luciferase family oxidoreductase group 1 [Pullulanibacillus pueri]GGH75738.1 hypothetical protein GCM10007096_05280 [Pullulanibacillus pueri]
MKLSILDQSPIAKGATPEEALNNTLTIADLADRLGYTRYWVAEHHNTNGLAGASPEVLIASIAAKTRFLKVGSGGVLLPQYSPYKVAENFKVLSALYPGRIDLGVGNSPGGSLATRLALTDNLRKSLNDFPRQVFDLLGFLQGDLPADQPFYEVKATPFSQRLPDPWILGIRSEGSKLAAEMGTGFIYGHFINPHNGEQALKHYREAFRPSKWLREPQAITCIFVVCADTQGEAERLALSQDGWLLNVGKKNGDTRIPSPEEVKARTYTVNELKKISENRKRMVIGTPEKVKEQLIDLQKRYRTDEFMVISNLYDFKAKQHSYELLAEAFALEKTV